MGTARHFASEALRSDRLLVDPRVRIVTARDDVYCVGPRGYVRLQGKNLGLLHERLQGLLDGRLREEQIVSAAGAQGTQVKSYLESLREAGVLSAEAEWSPLPPELPEPRRGDQHLQIGAAELAINLERPCGARGANVELSFGSAREIEAALGVLTTLANRVRIWIRCSAAINSLELERRAAVARHVLAAERGRGTAGRLIVFDLRADRTDLRRVVHLTNAPRKEDMFWERLGIITPMNAPQLPLPLYTYSGGRIACGLTAEAIVREAQLALLGHRSLFEHGEGVSCAPGAEGLLEIVATPGTFSCCEDGSDTSEIIVAQNEIECVEKLAMRWARAHGGGAQSRIDAISAAPPSARVDALQRIVRLRRGAVVGALDDSRAPLYVWQGDQGVVVRIGLEELFAEVIVRAIMSSFAPELAVDMFVVPSLEGGEERIERLGCIGRHLAQPIRAIVGRCDWIGGTVHFGKVQ